MFYVLYSVFSSSSSPRAGGCLAGVAALACMAGMVFLARGPASDPPASLPPTPGGGAGAVASAALPAPVVEVVDEASRRRAVPLHEQGHYYGGVGALHSAIEVLSAALTHDPGDVCARCDLAEARASLGDDGTAARDFSAALERDEGLARAWTGRGGARLRMGDLQGALLDLDRAVALSSEALFSDVPGGAALRGAALAFELRGMTRLRRREAAQALADLDQAIELRPTHEALWARAQLRSAAQDLEGALGDLERFISVAPAQDPRRVSARGTAGTLRQQLER